ncbi:hypothetical protein Hgul01_05442 [Herpetosiphon gulosus]|uniref:HEAT repeat domain-containing protein n=1 Tax=Herpetosiphon gulosus TaxID=1973496 RepID=A0ABP9X894_9CHLR
MNSLNDALTIAQLIDNPTKRSETLSTIAQAAVSMNSLNDALTIAQLIDNPTKRSETLSTIAQAAASKDDFETSTIVAQLIDNNWIRDEVFDFVSQIAVSKGNFNSGVTIAEAIGDHKKRAEVLNIIAQTILSKDNHSYAAIILQKAIQNAQSIEQIVSRDNTLVKIIPIVIYIDKNLALKLAQSIISDDLRIKTLIVVLEEYQEYDSHILNIFQLEWNRCLTYDTVWVKLPLIIPLLKTHKWLGTMILEEEGWVNAQLKRLG